MTENTTIEVETDAVDEAELEALAAEHDTCNGFAFSYMEASENDVVVRDATFLGGDSGQHCYVYDRDRDVTIDVTLGQFDGCPDIGAWDGDEHAHIGAWDYLEQWDGHHEWESRDEFEAHYGAMSERDNPFYI